MNNSLMKSVSNGLVIFDEVNQIKDVNIKKLIKRTIYNRRYYHKHIDRIYQYQYLDVECVCCERSYKRYDISRHKKTRKHLKNKAMYDENKYNISYEHNRKVDKFNKIITLKPYQKIKRNHGKFLECPF